MPAMLADGRLRLRALPEKPADPRAVTAAEANAGEELECRVLKSDYRLSPTASDTVPDTLLCSEGNAVTFGASNYEGSLTPVRMLDEDGLADPVNDVAWDLTKAKGTTLWLLESEGRSYEDEFEAGDEYSLFEVVTDNPQAPSDRTGWIKRTVPLGVQNAWLDHTITGA